MSVRYDKTIWAFDHEWSVSDKFDDLLPCGGIFDREADKFTAVVAVQAVVEFSWFPIVCGYGGIQTRGDLDADVCVRHPADLAPDDQR